MKDQLKTFIQTELLDEREIADDENLLLTGLIDSMGVMRLVAFVDESLKIAIPPEDLTIENFSNLNAMHQYLEGRLVQ
jgi:acyl carrier protein